VQTVLLLFNGIKVDTDVAQSFSFPFSRHRTFARHTVSVFPGCTICPCATKASPRAGAMKFILYSTVIRAVSDASDDLVVKAA
jgi:hypothetical protein